MSLRKPLDQRVMIGNPFVKHHPMILHALKSILPSAITIMHLGRRGFKQLGVVYQEFFRKHGFATSRRSHHQDRGGGMKTKRFPRLHDDDTTQGEKKGTFLLESVGLEPTHDPPTPVFRGIQRLYRLSYDSDTTFFQRILFNHYIDDTDDNKVDTIWLLGLQSIVEGVDRLDGHY